MNMLVCIIERSKWARKTKNAGKGISLLINGQGNLCCLGFLSLACGIPPAVIDGKTTPTEVVKLDETEGAKYPANVDWDPFINVNDDWTTTDAQKEAKLMELAKANGFEFQFVTKSVE
jgi:hypothetical protein